MQEITMKNIVSFGAGQNSTAMIIMMKNEGIKIDEIIFADPENEMPETYIFLKEFKKWCKKNKLKFTTVQSHLGNLKKHYSERKIIPYRMFRSCTDKFKVRPIHKYLKKYDEEINMFMGISVEERHRADRMGNKKNIIFKFPLIEKNIDRGGCVEIIKKEGLSVPVKSGCYFCPFQSKKSWKELHQKHPELFEDSNKFERNGRAYPEGNLIGNMTLETFRKIIKEQKELGDFKEDVSLIKCAYCHT